MSDGQSDGSDPSENGSADGQSVEEQTVDGQAVEGQSTGGQSAGGQSTGGQSTGGQSTGGQPAENGSAGGQSTGGQSAGGQSAGGQSTGGQSAGGQSADSQSSGGQSAGQSAGQSPGQPAGQSAGQPGGQNAGQSTGQSPGQPSGQSAGQTAGQSPGQPAGQSAGQPGQGRQPSDSMTGPAAGGTDLEPNVAAAIAYVFAPLTGILMLLLEGDEDDFVRFHSIQSIGFGAAVIGAYVVIGMIVGVLTAIPFVGDYFALLALPLNGFVGLAAFAGWALLILKAHQGERYALPVIGPIAASN